MEQFLYLQVCPFIQLWNHQQLVIKGEMSQFKISFYSIWVCFHKLLVVRRREFRKLLFIEFLLSHCFWFPRLVWYEVLFLLFPFSSTRCRNKWPDQVSSQLIKWLEIILAKFHLIETTQQETKLWNIFQTIPLISWLLHFSKPNALLYSITAFPQTTTKIFIWFGLYQKKSDATD